MKYIYKILIIVSLFQFLSCKQQYENKMISQLQTDKKINLNTLVASSYDYVIILDEGETLKKNNITVINEKEWLGQKILFIKNDFIVLQINLKYYSSKPEKGVYISFFRDSSPGRYYIKRYKDNIIFKIDFIQKISDNSFCYYLK